MPVLQPNAGAQGGIASAAATVVLPTPPFPIARMTPWPGAQGGPDGMKVDAQGRVFVTGAGGVWVFDAKGAVLGNAEAEAKILSRTPMGRMGEPSEVAQAALFLASDEASYFTGQALYPDGGRLALNYTVPVRR